MKKGSSLKRKIGEEEGGGRTNLRLDFGTPLVLKPKRFPRQQTTTFHSFNQFQPMSLSIHSHLVVGGW